ncbi:MAG: YgiT-type zinc finger protein [Candidatus Kapaibacteriota bacterium]|jgi:YgiT-type zinc finger domain-containing protein
MNTTCNVCGSSSFEEQRIDDIYENPNGEKIVVEHIPALVCTVCGERTLSLETTRHIFALLDAQMQPAKHIPAVEYI